MSPIEVPAGKVRAYKIESEGHWLAELAPNQKVTQGAQSGESGATLLGHASARQIGGVCLTKTTPAWQLQIRFQPVGCVAAHVAGFLFLYDNCRIRNCAESR